jgi:hypothetical protein
MESDWTRPTLEVTLLSLGVAREGRLRLLLLQGIQDLSVRDVADLEVLLDQLPILVAHSAFLIWHHSIAGIVRLANIAVDAGPALRAFTLLRASSW